MQQYRIFIRPDHYVDGGFCYVAEHPDLPGCTGYGEDIESAKAALGEAREAYLQHLKETGRSAPDPQAGPSVEWESAFTTEQVAAHA